MTTSYDEFLALFPVTPRKKYKNGYYVQCSVHADKEPSLFIEPSNNPDFTVDFKCFAGCNNEAILKSKNLAYDDIRINHNGHKPQSSPHKEIEAIYKYTKDGKLIFEVVRTNPKSFFQRRPDGKGNYINNLDGIAPFLYQYDELPRAINDGDIIYIPEGEKDADNLWNMGLIATTNPMGAGTNKWLDSYSDTLKGGRVIVLEDYDKVGKDFAQQKLNSLYGKASSLKFVELPGASESIKDITDWFNAGHNTDEFLQIVEDTPEWTPDYDTTKKLINLKDVEVKKVDWLAYPYIPIGYLTIVEGDPGDGKSTVTLAIAAGISKAANVGWANFPLGKTLIMSAEDGLGDIIKPKLINMDADCSKVTAIKELLTLDEQGLEILGKYIKYVNPILVIIDPIVAYTDKAMNINQANQVRWLMSRLARLAEIYNLALIVVRHLTKSNNSKAVYRGSGSIDFTASARSVLLSGSNDDTGEKVLLHTKCNLAEKGEALGYKLITFGLEWTGKSDMTYRDISSENGGALDDAKAWLEQTLQDGDKEAEYIFTEGRNKYNLSPSTLKRAKKALNIDSYSKPELGKKGAGKWFWNLPGVPKND